MLARGDLVRVVLRSEKVPGDQKRSQKPGTRAGKPVGCDQMLESDDRNRRVANRAEVSDCGQCLFECADAVHACRENRRWRLPG